MLVVGYLHYKSSSRSFGQPVRQMSISSGAVRTWFLNYLNHTLFLLLHRDANAETKASRSQKPSSVPDVHNLLVTSLVTVDLDNDTTRLDGQ
jgi:hypothetical protein